jgi:hypothetical protein
MFAARIELAGFGGSSACTESGYSEALDASPEGGVEAFQGEAFFLRDRLVDILDPSDPAGLVSLIRSSSAS